MKQKSVFDLWANIRISHLNRLLRPFNIRLVEKKSKAWGDKVVITAEKIPDAVSELIAGAALTPQALDGMVGALRRIIADNRFGTEPNTIARNAIEAAGLPLEAGAVPKVDARLGEE